jgi:hypothetical protein
MPPGIREQTVYSSTNFGCPRSLAFGDLGKHVGRRDFQRPELRFCARHFKNSHPR